MPLNATAEEINAQADFDFNEKLRLEAIFEKELNTVFNRMSIDMRKQLRAGVSSFEVSVYQDRIKETLEKHARRVSKSFTGQVLDFLDSNSDNLSESIINDLTTIAEVKGTNLKSLLSDLRKSTNRKSLEFNLKQSALDSLSISATNQTEVDTLIAMARSQFDNNADIAADVVSRFKAKIPGRTSNIATTFTQKTAENTKNTERQNFFQTRNGIDALEANLPQIQEEEFWVTRADNVVRPAHLEADFTRKQGVAFIVDGEQLRFPGDPELGASIKNLARCRCSAVISIE